MSTKRLRVLKPRPQKGQVMVMQSQGLGDTWTGSLENLMDPVPGTYRCLLEYAVFRKASGNRTQLF